MSFRKFKVICTKRLHAAILPNNCMGPNNIFSLANYTEDGKNYLSIWHVFSFWWLHGLSAEEEGKWMGTLPWRGNEQPTAGILFSCLPKSSWCDPCGSDRETGKDLCPDRFFFAFVFIIFPLLIAVLTVSVPKGTATLSSVVIKVKI